MPLIETLNYYIQQAEADLEGLSWDIREETNYQGETHDLMMDDLCESYDLVKQQLEDLQQIKSELARLQRYDEELSSVMPNDYKDWWQGSKEEWPIIAKSSIESSRAREKLAWQQVEFDYKMEVQ
jgi:hypothetical protein